jgi:Uncharacterized conserved protein
MPYTEITVRERAGVTATIPVEINIPSTWPGWDVATRDNIYVTDDLGNPLYFWIEELDTANRRGIIHVKLALSAGETKTIRLYYGETPPAGYHDCKQVFIFCQDFRFEQTLDLTNVWGTGGNQPLSYQFTPEGLVMSVTGGFRHIVTLNPINYATLKKIIVRGRIANENYWGMYYCVTPTLLTDTSEPAGLPDWVTIDQKPRTAVRPGMGITKKVAGTVYDVWHSDVSGTTPGRHVVKLLIAPTGTIIYNLNYSEVYRNTAETLYSTGDNYFYILVSSDTALVEGITSYVAIGDTTDPDPEVIFEAPPPPPITGSSYTEEVIAEAPPPSQPITGSSYTEEVIAEAPPPEVIVEAPPAPVARRSWLILLLIAGYVILRRTRRR